MRGSAAESEHSVAEDSAADMKEGGLRPEVMAGHLPFIKRERVKVLVMA